MPQNSINRFISKMASPAVSLIFIWILTVLVSSAKSEFEGIRPSRELEEKREIDVAFIVDGVTLQSARLTRHSYKRILELARPRYGLQNNFKWCVVGYGKFFYQSEDERQHSCMWKTDDDVRDDLQMQEPPNEQKKIYKVSSAFTQAVDWLEANHAAPTLMYFGDEIGSFKQLDAIKYRLENLDAQVLIGRMSRKAKSYELAKFAPQENIRYYDDFQAFAYKIRESLRRRKRKRKSGRKGKKGLPIGPWSKPTLPPTSSRKPCVCPKQSCVCPPQKPPPCVCSPQQKEPCCCSPQQQQFCVCSPQQQTCVCPQVISCPITPPCVCPTTASPPPLATCPDSPYQKFGCYQHLSYHANDAVFYTVMTPSSMRDWKDFLNALVCQCSAAAKDKKHPWFGVKYYSPIYSDGYRGECFTSDSIKKFMTYGPSNACIDTSKMVCVADQKDCTGQKGSLYVYSRNIQGEGWPQVVKGEKYRN